MEMQTAQDASSVSYSRIEPHFLIAARARQRVYAVDRIRQHSRCRGTRG